jgi:hypothetical protein
MPKVEIVRPGATHNRKPLGEVGEVVEVDEKTAAAMERYGLAKPAEDKADEPAENDENSDENSEDNDSGENPAEKREKATSQNAAKRETRNN